MKCTKVEHDNRVRQVAAWIIAGQSYTNIVNDIMLKWFIEERQAKRYLQKAWSVFVAEDNVEFEEKKAFYKSSRLELYREAKKELLNLTKSKLDLIERSDAMVKWITVIDKLMVNMSKVDGIHQEKLDLTSNGQSVGETSTFEVFITASGTTVEENDNLEE